MLGEKIGELQGKTIGIRVIAEGPALRFESTAQEMGRILGVEGTNLVTYVSSFRPDGTLTGEGHGMFAGKDGDVVTFTARGVGRPTGKGQAASWRGALICQTTSSKLARLNGLVVLVEYEVDENGNSHGKFWEWK